MYRDLRKLSRVIWLLIGGGALLFTACVVLLAATHPATPANELINRRTAWLFLPSVVMAAAGVYMSLRYWRCPHCGHPIATRFPIPKDCPHCGRDIGFYS